MSKGSLLEGSVVLSASLNEIKESALKDRDRKIIMWTPVLLWPTGFPKIHKKETKVY